MTSSLPDYFTPTALFVNSSTSKNAIASDKTYTSLSLFSESEAQLDEMIGSVDLVVICSPPSNHLLHVQKCIGAGKHCIIEKPISGDHDSAMKILALADTAKERGLSVSVFQNRRWDSNYLQLKQIIRDGTLGRIVAVKSRMDRWRPQAKGNGHWRENPDQGGLLLDLGSHLVDQMYALFGPPSDMTSTVTSQRSTTHEEANASSNDFFSITMVYADPLKPVVTIEAGSFVTCPHHRFEVHGTKGAWTVDGEDPQESQIKAGASPLSTGFGKHPEPATLYLASDDGTVQAPQQQTVTDGTWIEFYRGVARSIAEGRGEVEVAVKDVVACLDILEKAKKCAIH